MRVAFEGTFKCLQIYTVPLLGMQLFTGQGS